MGSLRILLFLAVMIFGACKKETASVINTAPEIKKYALKTSSGSNAGIFTIGSNRDGESIVTIELDQKSHIHGTTYTANLCAANTEACYAKLIDVNAVIGYCETVNVTEEATGKILTADELFKKHGYQVKISSNNAVIAVGNIE